MFRVAALGLATLAALAVAEVGLILTRGEQFFPYEPNQVFKKGPFDTRFTPGVSGDAYFTSNSFGCRGPEPDGEQYRLLCVGGSTTNCMALDDSEAWPQVLMERVNEAKGDPRFLWVTASGKEGRNSRHHIAHAEHLVPRIPDLDHVLIYCGINDVVSWILQDKFTQDDLADPTQWREIVAESFWISSYTPSDLPWYRHLQLWRLLSTIKDDMETAMNASREEGGDRIDVDFQQWMQIRKNKRQERSFRRLDAARLERFEVEVAAYRDRLVRLADSARAAGAEPIFMPQAMHYRDLSEEELRHLWVGRFPDKTMIDPDQLQDLVDQVNDVMREVAAEMNVALVDLPALLQGEEKIFHDGVHFSEHGSRTAAQLIATALLEKVYQQ